MNPSFTGIPLPEFYSVDLSQMTDQMLVPKGGVNCVDWDATQVSQMIEHW